jgi:ribonuclease D
MTHRNPATKIDMDSPQLHTDFSRRSVHWIDTEGKLAKLSDHLRTLPVISVDIEADSLHHYRDRVCLIQISTEMEDWLLDPSVLKSMDSLAAILENPDIVKVFHAADFDLRSLDRDFGFRVRQIFDTKIAAELSGLETLSLAGLLEKYFQVTLLKKYQKYNWSYRPLPEPAMRYAVMDTRYLIDLKTILTRNLEELQRIQWAYDEFEHLETIRWQPSRNSQLGFWKLKESRTMNPEQRIILKALWEWRETVAEKCDQPPFKIAPDQVLTSIVQSCPKDPESVKKIFGKPSQYRGKWIEEILMVLKNAYAAPASNCPSRPLRADLPAATRKILKKVKSIRIDVARGMAISPALLLSNESMEMISGNIADALNMDEGQIYMLAGVRGWQWRILKPVLSAKLTWQQL